MVYETENQDSYQFYMNSDINAGLLAFFFNKETVFMDFSIPDWDEQIGNQVFAW